MKKFLITIIAIIIGLLIVAGVGLPYYFGLGSEKQALERKKELLDNNKLITSGLLSLDSYKYERGWFDSKETLVIRVAPDLLDNQNRAEDVNRFKTTMLSEPITIINHIKHGPFAHGYIPIRAFVTTEIKYGPQIQKILTKLFGNVEPLHIDNIVYLNGNGRINFSVSPVDYTQQGEKGKININWQKLEGFVKYSRHFKEYTLEYHLPSLNIKYKDHISLGDDINIRMDNMYGNNHVVQQEGGIPLIDQKYKLDKFSIMGGDRLKKYDIGLSKFQYVQNQNQDGNWVNIFSGTQFKDLTYDNKLYGPFDFKISFEHLDSDALHSFYNKYNELYTQKDHETKQAILMSSVMNLLDILAKDPVVKLDTFILDTPWGKIDISGDIKFKGISYADIMGGDQGQIAKKIEGTFNIQLPYSLIKENGMNDADEETIKSLAEEGYIKLDENTIQTKLGFSDGVVKLNNQKFDFEKYTKSRNNIYSPTEFDSDSIDFDSDSAEFDSDSTDLDSE